MRERDRISGRLGLVIDYKMQGSPGLLAPAYAKQPAAAFVVQEGVAKDPEYASKYFSRP